VILKADSAYYNGQIILNNTKDQIGAQIDGSEGVGGGQINLFNSKNIPTLQIDAEGGGLESFLSLRNSADVNTFTLFANDSENKYGASMLLKGNDGKTGVRIDGQEHDGGGQVIVYNKKGNYVIQMDAEGGEGILNSGFIEMRDPELNSTLRLYSKRGSSHSSAIDMRNDDNVRTVHIESQEGLGNGGAIKLYNDKGELSIELDGEAGSGGKGRVITQVLEITGGSDFAESFDVSENEDIKPGMVVSIDEVNSGKLKLSETKYDKQVAGIISGANGIDTGLMMSDNGTIADGQYPIALSGRVYVKTNEENGKIKVGDFLTTSSNKGIAMKVSKIKKAQGSIIGKAMTKVDDNGFVLILVNLQ